MGGSPPRQQPRIHHALPDRFFESTARGDVKTLDVEREQVTRRIESLIAEWEGVEAEIGKLA